MLLHETLGCYNPEKIEYLVILTGASLRLMYSLNQSFFISQNSFTNKDEKQLGKEGNLSGLGLIAFPVLGTYLWLEVIPFHNSMVHKDESPRHPSHSSSSNPNSPWHPQTKKSL